MEPAVLQSKSSLPVSYLYTVCLASISKIANTDLKMLRNITIILSNKVVSASQAYINLHYMYYCGLVENSQN